MLCNLRDSILTEEFDYNLLKQALVGYKNPRVKINDLLKKGDIIRVKKGLYVFGQFWTREPYSKESLANLIYGPSYISLEYALSFYGLIPERIERITSITNKKKKLFETPVGIFSYRYIHPSLYFIGITLYQMDKHHCVLMASKEKALADKLYFEPKMDDSTQMRQYLFENLRIDKEELKKFNFKKVRLFARLYKKNIRLFCDFLETLK